MSKVIQVAGANYDRLFVSLVSSRSCSVADPCRPPLEAAATCFHPVVVKKFVHTSSIGSEARSASCYSTDRTLTLHSSLSLTLIRRHSLYIPAYYP
jgi:hypothetical protein